MAFLKVPKPVRWALAIALLAACGEAPAGGGSADDDDGENGGAICRDEDGDGFGVGCAAGTDCNDEDDTITEECTCTELRAGCVCEEDAAPVGCDLTKEQLPEHAALCKVGMRYCRDGVWTECIGISVFE